MAKTTKLRVWFAEKRTINYQTVEHGAECEVEIEPGEKPGDVLKRCREYLQSQVSDFTYAEVLRLDEERRTGRDVG